MPHGKKAGWIPTRSATPSTALVPQRKVGFPIPNTGLLLGFQGTKTARREGISSPFSDAGGCTSPQNSGVLLGVYTCCTVNHGSDGVCLGLPHFWNNDFQHYFSVGSSISELQRFEPYKFPRRRNCESF